MSEDGTAPRNFGRSEEDIREIVDYVLGKKEDPVPCVVSLQGPECPCRVKVALQESPTSRNVCLATSTTIAYEVNRLWQRHEELAGGQEDPSNGNEDDRLERFLRVVFSTEQQEKWRNLPDNWAKGPPEPRADLNTVLDVEPFKSFEGFSAQNYRHEWTEIHSMKEIGRAWFPKSKYPFAALLAAKQHTALCLQLPFKNERTIWMVLDLHPRTFDDVSTGGPTSVIHTSLQSTCEDIYHIVHSWASHHGSVYMAWNSLLLARRDESTEKTEGTSNGAVDEFNLHNSGVSHEVNGILPTDTTFTSPTEGADKPDGTLNGTPSGNVSSEANGVLTTTKTSSSTSEGNDKVASPLHTSRIDNVSHEANGILPTVSTSTSAEPSLSKKKSTKSLSSDSPSVRNRASQYRLQKEFGWQLTLQNTKSTPRLPNATEDPVVESKKVDKQEKHASTEKEREKVVKNTSIDPPKGKKDTLYKEEEKSVEAPPIVDEASINLRTPTHDQAKSDTVSVASSSKRRRDMSKKDIGWQLALQQNTGPVKATSSAVVDMDATVLTPPELPYAAKNASASLSTESLSTKKAKRKNEVDNQLMPTTAQTARSDIERQKPVRNEFGWQHGLVATSFTQPITHTAQYQYLDEPQPELVLSALAGVTVTSEEQGARRREHKLQQIGADEFECEHCHINFSTQGRFLLQGCDHWFCRACLRQYILEKLQEDVYPITCPACTLYGDTRNGRVTLSIVTALGIAGNDRAKFQRLDLSSSNDYYSCPKCRAVSNKKRDLYTFSSRDTCPGMSTCRYQQCKACHRQTKENAPHECARSLKVDKQLRRKGSRFCPGCRTEIRDLGKGDIAIECPTPGCRLHFCYRCGDKIADLIAGDTLSEYAILRHNDGRCASNDKCTIM